MMETHDDNHALTTTPRHECAARWLIVVTICRVLGPLILTLLVIALLLPFVMGRVEAVLADLDRPVWPPVMMLINLGRWLGGRLHFTQVIPGLFVVAPALLGVRLAMWLLQRHAKERHRWLAEGCCHQCGYDLRGTVAAGRGQCPECGTAILR